MKKITFTVEIGMYNEIDVRVDVTPEEYALLKQYSDSDEIDFHECQELKDLYSRVIEAAYDEMADSISDDQDFIDENLDGIDDYDSIREYVVDNYNLSVVWPTIENE